MAAARSAGRFARGVPVAAAVTCGGALAVAIVYTVMYIGDVNETQRSMIEAADAAYAAYEAYAIPETTPAETAPSSSELASADAGIRDVCENLAGTQSSVPAGMIHDGDGCVS